MIIKNFKIQQQKVKENKKIIYYEDDTIIKYNNLNNIEFEDPIKNKEFEIIEIKKNVKKRKLF